jgi:hypothetical protein
MNSFLASSIPLTAAAILSLPMVAAARSSGDAVLKWTLSGALALCGAVAALQAGLVSRAPSWATTAATFSAQTDPEKCAKLIGVLQQYGVITQPVRPGLLVVSRTIWGNLPVEAQQMAQMCAAKDGSPADVEFAGPG